MSLIIKMDEIKTIQHMKKAIPYVLNEVKTEGLFWSNSGINADMITDTFMRTKEMHPARGNRQAYHFKFSFSKDETISAEAALEFAKEWIEEYLGDKYDYVVSVHSDRDHMHMHLVFNSVAREGGKFRYETGDWNKIIKPLTNYLADKYHTGHLKEKNPVLDYSSDYEKDIIKIIEGKTGINLPEDVVKQINVSGGKFSWKHKVQLDIDRCIEKSKSYADFKRRMQVDFHYGLREGVSREHGVYLALTPPGKAKAIRSYRLDEGYMPVDIESRINGEKIMKWPSIPERYRRHFGAWSVVRNQTYIPYEQLSEYQKVQVKRMLEAKRLYHRTNASLQLHEQSVRAIDGMMDEIVKRYKKPDIEQTYVVSQEKMVTEEVKLREHRKQDRNAKKHRH